MVCSALCVAVGVMCVVRVGCEVRVCCCVCARSVYWFVVDVLCSWACCFNTTCVSCCRGSRCGACFVGVSCLLFVVR